MQNVLKSQNKNDIPLENRFSFDKVMAV